MIKFNVLSKFYKSKYYIYEHYINNELFYIGKGQKLRALELNGRSKRWNKRVEENGGTDEVTIEIIAHFDVNEEALNFKKKHIKKMYHSKANLVNFNYNNNIPLNIKNKKLNVNVTVPKEYLDKSLTTQMKKELCDELNIIGVQGKQIKWPSLKKQLIKNGYFVKDTQIRIEGKRTKVSIITEEDL